MTSGLKFQTWFSVLLTTLSAMLMGYDVGIISGAILFIVEEMKLSVWKEEMIIGSLNVVAAFSAIAAGFFANRYGRKRTLEMAAFVFFAGAVLLAAAPGFICLMAGRVLTGVGVGFAMMIAPLYSAEISPAKIRGFLVSFTEIFVDVGIVLGYIFGFAFQFLNPAYNWRLMLGVSGIPAVVLFFGTAMALPESPRWLVMQGFYEEALEVLERTVCAEGGDAKEKLAEIMNANEVESEKSAGCSDDGRDRRPFNPTNIFRSQACRGLAKTYVAAIGVNFIQQATGIEATVYYSPMIFKVAGVHSRLGMLGATLCVGVVKLGFVLVATSTLDRIGRKTLLIASSIGMIASLLVICATFKINGINIDASSSSANLHDNNVALITVVSICAYVAFFSIGWGPIAYVFSAEIFPLKHRSKALGCSMFVNRIVSGAVAFSFLTISQAITLTGTFSVFCVVTVISIIFTVFLIPETKGKSLEELAEECATVPTPPRSSTSSDINCPLLS
ncbi:hypothetical protein KP509_26G055200 [Ceratopteris richardii]|uniref:Major facilitator superfamily (MFS) profile domain-containing protein n=1 Tax=Ceratopteris richardii TaxID=49495 RepID=A0A8T2RKV7_CERRI|nr:hypothetical protein KP509_26G055200 [Ceratopteris richardii]